MLDMDIASLVIREYLLKYSLVAIIPIIFCMMFVTYKNYDHYTNSFFIYLILLIAQVFLFGNPFKNSTYDAIIANVARILYLGCCIYYVYMLFTILNNFGELSKLDVVINIIIFLILLPHLLLSYHLIIHILPIDDT